MPNVSAHMIVAKEVGKRLNLNSDEFIKGNLLPDIIDIDDSHHKIWNGFYMVPDIEYFLQNLDFSNDLNIGYLTHLLLDKHYLVDYLQSLYPNKNIFLDGTVYKDYDYLNFLLVKRFELDIDKLENILNQYDCKISEEKLKKNLECLKQKKAGETKYLNFENFVNFLLEVSDIISNELIECANKSSKLYIHIKQ